MAAMKRIYLDNAATTPMDPEVLKAMLPFLSDSFGNPSSIHSFGQETRAVVEESRDKIASLISARSEEIVFTGGGTEADNFAIKGAAFANEGKGDHIITTSIEHHAVMESYKFLERRGFRITYLPVGIDGLVDPQDVKKAIKEKKSGESKKLEETKTFTKAGRPNKPTGNGGKRSAGFQPAAFVQSQAKQTSDKQTPSRYCGICLTKWAGRTSSAFIPASPCIGCTGRLPCRQQKRRRPIFCCTRRWE